MQRRLKPLVLSWVVVVAAICPSHAQQPGRNAPGANVKPIETLDYKTGQNRTLALPNAVTLDLIWIAPGTFTMGEPCSENIWTMHDPSLEDCSPDDVCPQTVVTISKEFWLGKTLVTQGQYQAVMGNNPSHFVKAGADAPVEQVSWDDAREYCRKLTEQERAAGRLPEGYAYTLPTEAQWEYACRAGTTGAWYGKLNDIAWYGKNSGNTTHPVAEKRPNEFGLYDMIGNVCEWCFDEYGPYPGGNATDPAGPGWGPYGAYRVFRGGDWAYRADNCRSTNRHGIEPGYRGSDLGFRLALAPSQTPLPPRPATSVQTTGKADFAAPWIYSFNGTSPEGESITGALFYRGQFIPMQFRHVATPIGEFEVCGRTGYRGSGLRVCWAPAYLAHNMPNSREVRIGEDDRRARAILSGKEGKMRTTEIEKNPPVVSNKSCIQGRFENRPVDAGADWFFVFDQNLWVDPEKIEAVESKLTERPLYARNFGNMGVVECNAICDKIREQGLASILQAWIDADRVEHDQGKHGMLGTTLMFAMRERTPSPEFLAQMRAFIYDPANSDLDREILITNLGYAQREETTGLLLDMWAHPPADLDLKNNLQSALGQVAARRDTGGNNSEAARAVLTGERVRPVLLMPVHLAALLGTGIVEGLLIGLIPFFVFRSRDKKWARNALLVCAAAGLFGVVVLALAAIIIVILGLSRPAPSETPLEEVPRPPAKLPSRRYNFVYPDAPVPRWFSRRCNLGIVSLAIPILAAGVIWIWLLHSALSPPPINYAPSYGPVFPDSLLWIIGMLAVAAIAGTVLAIFSLWKRERWPLIAAIGLIVNGVPCLYVLWLVLCLVVRAFMQG